jgi:Fe-S-cluster-containing hydrogenase component 2
VRVQCNPLHSLQAGNWFKLICGASYQHLTAIRSLVIAYSLAGADCIDVAADPAVIRAAREGLAVVKQLQAGKQQSRELSWLMVSVNDGEDPHFRKAEFDATQCPSQCPQPCVVVCPAGAIEFKEGFSGVIENHCYGCGRCLPICPAQLIESRSHSATLPEIIPLIGSMAIDAIEIHTQVGRYESFQRLWQVIASELKQLKLISISCTDAPGAIDYLRSLYDLIQPLPIPLIWQTDGRSMSGDIGKGTTHAAIAFGRKVLTAKLPGYVQLAGGTNSYTITKLQADGLLLPKQKRQSLRANSSHIAGVAYGSYARQLLSPILEQLENVNPTQSRVEKLEDDPELLRQAVALACDLVSPIKFDRPN